MPPDPRRTLAAAVLLVLMVLAAGQEGLPLFRLSDERGWEPWRDLQIARSMIPLHGSQRDYVGPGYARDRNYAVFLWNARRANPDARRILLRSKFSVRDNALGSGDWAASMGMLRRDVAQAARDESNDLPLHEAVYEMCKRAYRYGRVTQVIIEDTRVTYYSAED